MAVVVVVVAAAAAVAVVVVIVVVVRAFRLRQTSMTRVVVASSMKGRADA